MRAREALRADVSAQEDPSLCSIHKPFKVGCCSKDSHCGFTPAHCAPLKLMLRLAYEELFALDRGCGVKMPENLPLGAWTHLNLAFGNFPNVDGIRSLERNDGATSDWTMIDLGLDLLWHNGPNGIYKLSDGDIPGSCSDTKGVLTGKRTTVKYKVFGGSQWMSYDDGESFQHLASPCMGGLMIWAIDQDTSDSKFGKLMGDYSHLNQQQLDADSAEELSDLLDQYNGQHCYVTERCTRDGNDQKSADQVHTPLGGDYAVGWYRPICPRLWAFDSSFDNPKTKVQLLHTTIPTRKHGIPSALP
ncbi:hypothetical protein VTI74DRAFT_1874 [Chaetomium olivicolor]